MLLRALSELGLPVVEHDLPGDSDWRFENLWKILDDAKGEFHFWFIQYIQIIPSIDVKFIFDRPC